MGQLPFSTGCWYSHPSQRLSQPSTYSPLAICHSLCHFISWEHLSLCVRLPHALHIFPWPISASSSRAIWEHTNSSVLLTIVLFVPMKVPKKENKHNLSKTHTWVDVWKPGLMQGSVGGWHTDGGCTGGCIRHQVHTMICVQMGWWMTDR